MGGALKVSLAAFLIFLMVSCVKAPEVLVSVSKRNPDRGETVVITVETSSPLRNVEIFVLSSLREAPYSVKGYDRIDGRKSFEIRANDPGSYSILLKAALDDRPVEYYFPDIFVVE